MKDGKISYPVRACTKVSPRILDSDGDAILTSEAGKYGSAEEAYVRDIAIAALNAAHTQWQPIETAPRDRAIRLGRHGLVPISCIRKDGMWEICGTGMILQSQPTHWAECEPPPALPEPEPEDDPAELLRRALDVLHQHACTSREAIRIDRDGRNFLAAHDGRQA